MSPAAPPAGDLDLAGSPCTNPACTDWAGFEVRTGRGAPVVTICGWHLPWAIGQVRPGGDWCQARRLDDNPE